MSLIQCWRWYGPQDPVSLDDIKQAGAEGVVSALHHLETGAVWSVDEIQARQQLIAKKQLHWQVVESVNVHDAIKLGSPERSRYLDNYCQTLQNLADCGIRTVCYNFMPVLDWTRTDLDFNTDSGAKALRFNPVALAAFDRFILDRQNAREDYEYKVWNLSENYWQQLDQNQRTELSNTILAGVPGSRQTISLDYFKAKLIEYKDISRDILKSNFKYFIQQVAPVAAA